MSSPNMEQVKTKKKRSSPEMEHFFSPNSSRDLRSDAHQSQIIEGDADEDHSSVARGGGGARAPHWLVKYAKSHVFGAFEADFFVKNWK